MPFLLSVCLELFWVWHLALVGFKVHLYILDARKIGDGSRIDGTDFW